MRDVVRQVRRALYTLAYYRRELSARCAATVAGVTKRSGTTRQHRPQPLIVSRTTIPARLSKVHITIHHLLQQSVQPDRIILWITAEMARALPKPLQRQQARGLEICITTDIGPLTKFVHCREAYPHALIVTADDDIFYPRDWLEPLYAAYLREPQHIHAHRAHEITFTEGQPQPYAEWNWQAPGVDCASLRLVATGVGGVLYAPGHLHPEGLSNYYQGGNDRQLAAVLNHYQIRLPDNNQRL